MVGKRNDKSGIGNAGHGFGLSVADLGRISPCEDVFSVGSEINWTVK
ncbi:MAG UNVERIFIED_CONTAM: hypothetical protein LVR29_00980 [Microcystis novacekii LVE1205-3]